MVDRDEYRREKSRSQMKREMTALQVLGEELTQLDEGRLAALPLTADLRLALAELKSMRVHEARRRQIQYIGRLMRDLDPEPLREALAEMREGARRDARAHDRIESWRDRLVAGDEGVEEEIMQALPEADRQRLGQLARTARREAQRNQPPHASRKLFRYLRELSGGSTSPRTTEPSGETEEAGELGGGEGE